MWLKDIVIDGFKSYANRTVVNGFDPKFNAITGLNGSGKSNILDAICFVLGITQLTQVRVANLGELVYKQGQARVTKATVTLVFDNSDAKSSPVGYDHMNEITVTRQVVIGGKNKYLINGSAAQQGRVQNLFHSVQLNVNNPHFLIMQGRIAKVIHMRPEELLSLVEEAAGTRMYETKKRAAQKLIAKKDAKVEEINKVIESEMEPQMRKLREERTFYVKFNANETEMVRMQRLLTALAFHTASQTVATAKNSEKETAEEIERCERSAAAAEREQEEAAQQIQELEQKRESAVSHSLKSMEETQQRRSKELIATNAAWQHAKENLESERANESKAAATIAEAEAALEANESEQKQLQASTAAEERAHIEREKHVASLQGVLLGVSVQQGQGAADGGDGSLPAQLMSEQKKAAQAESELKLVQNKKKHAVKQQQEKKKEVAAAEKESAGLLREQSEKQAELARIDKQLNALHANAGAGAGSSAAAAAAAAADELMMADGEERKEAPGKKGRGGRGKEEKQHHQQQQAAPASAAPAVSKKQLESRRGELERELRELRAKFNTMEAKVSAAASFEYTPPSKHFDKSAVHGPVAKLVRIKDEKASLALEVAAGGRLWNIVVDSQQVGKELLEKGGLKKRVTLIPLDKISARTLSKEVIARAQDLLGADNVQPALELIGCDDKLSKAMAYVFGSTFVCSTAEAARQCAFDKRIRNKAVTLAGDAFDPAGTMRGGSRNNSSGGVLQRLAELNALDGSVRAAEQQLAAVTTQLTTLNQREEATRELSAVREVCAHELSLLTQRLSGSTFAQLQQQLTELAATIEQCTQDEARLTTAYEAAIKRGKELEREIRDFDAQRVSKIKQAEKELASAKSELARSEKERKKRTAALEKLTLTAAQLKKDLAAARTQLKQAQDSVKEWEARAAAEEERVAAQHAKLDAAEKQLAEERKKLDALTQQMSALEKRRKAAKAEADSAALKQKKAAHELARKQSEAGEARRRVEQLRAQHEWIEAERRHFGVAGGDYDFSKFNKEEASERLVKLRAEQEQLGKKLNRKVLGMFEKAEQEYNELLKKRTIIQKDKAKIVEVIAELDVKKNEALQATWQKVNADFGSIFSSLLPGAVAKLAPPKGKTVLAGLEMTVGFGSVWKDSLSELSGGQSSLLALSLILALLRFKPAPIYILDEVDAALDLSHTQNIGLMLRTHFPQSQFIVVSLKEGMFNNANVIFRTKFVEGVSTVTRTVNKPSHEHAAKPILPMKGGKQQQQQAAIMPPADKKKQKKDKENAAPAADDEAAAM